VAPVTTASTTALSNNGPNPTVIGQAVSFAVSVSGSNPTGAVSLEDADNGNAVVGTGALNGGSASISVSNLSIGAHHLFAVYGGDGLNAASQSAQVLQTVDPIQVTSVVVNGDYIPIVGASESGTTATLTTNGDSGFAVNNQIVVAGFSGDNPGYNGAWTIVSVSGNQITYTDSIAGLPTVNGATAAYALSTNSSSALLGNQRSMVDSIVYNFNTPVNLATGAITLAATAQTVTSTGPATPAGAAANAAWTPLNGGAIWLGTFSSAAGNTRVGRSIADGVYDI